MTISIERAALVSAYHVGVKLSQFFSLALVGLAGLALQTPSKSKDPAAEGPAVEVSFPNTQHKGKADNICAADFRNIRLVRNADWVAQLRGGKYDHREPGGFESVNLGGIDCFDLHDGAPRYAVVTSTWIYGGGSSNTECVVQVFTLRSGHPVVVQQFEFDCHALGTGARFDQKSTKLTIRARTQEDSPHCCARNLDVVTYIWHDGKFKRRGFRRTPAVVAKGQDGLEYH